MTNKLQRYEIILPTTTRCSNIGNIFKPTALILDSGVGGLSVHKEIRNSLPNIRYIYVFDNAGFPYGGKNKSFIIERVLKIVYAVQKKHILSIIIIACNTASIMTLPYLRESFDIPIVGVVPAIKSAAQITHNGIIGLLATQLTIRYSYTHNLIARFAAQCNIKMLGSSELVFLAEHKLQGEEVNNNIIKKIIQPWLSRSKPPDTVVLGCTHFSLLRKEIAAVLPEGINLIDSCSAIAHRVSCILGNQENYINIENNIAYVTQNNSYTQNLLPVLKFLGFSRMIELRL
ncbi:Glutamate racemase [Candidatus Profftia tarda]|uniref:Glutamate racemase n=2 Tax=Candidatus Profftia tarda TaxID=1177216 RepID=A0A8E4GIK4_9ENTR|nr:Glutamate racemase [Candidatus Profftia tarda]